MLQTDNKNNPLLIKKKNLHFTN